MKNSIGITSALLIALFASSSRCDDYAKDNGWWFKNFKDPTLSWDIYRDTFIGIPPTENAVASLFDTLFYNQICKTELAKTGNCYGLSLLSVMIRKNGGHMGYCMPIPQYSGDIFGDCVNGNAAGPADPMLRRAINVMHGHQVNLPTLEFFLDVLAKHQNRNASYAYDTFSAVQMQEGPTLVSITKDLLPGKSAHTMVAYRAEDLGSSGRRIYVYDPFRTWADPDPDVRGWYVTNQNFIQINGTSWSFQMRGWACGVDTWSGNPASGGNIVIIPASVTGPHSRSPASLGASIIGKIVNTILLSGGSTEIEQVTDAQGKRLFKPGTYEVDSDPATGMMNMIPWTPSGQAGPQTSNDTILFQLGSSRGAVTVRVNGSESGYTLRSFGARNQVSVTARGGRGTDVITLAHPGSSDARIGLENTRGTSEYDIQFVQATNPGERLRVLSSNRMRIPEGAPVELAVTDQNRALTVSSPAANVQYDLELKTVTRDGETSLNKSRVVQPVGTLQTVQPRNWLNLKYTEVLESVRPVRH
jgi:hypothetical protein